jgi:predicted GNAT family acetyltransferase
LKEGGCDGSRLFFPGKVASKTVMEIKVTQNNLKHRFEVETSSRTAFLNYRVESGAITFTHTEVPEALNGRGIGTALVKFALDYARGQGLRVVPQCPFVASFVAGHPQYQSLVKEA